MGSRETQSTKLLELQKRKRILEKEIKMLFEMFRESEDEDFLQRIGELTFELAEITEDIDFLQSEEVLGDER